MFRTTHTASFVFALVFGSAGCTSVEAPSFDGDDDTRLPSLEASPMASPPLATNPLACSNKRWVGVRNAAGVCRPAAGWSVQPLIDGGPPPAHGPGDDDSVLGDYCVYEWTAGGAPALGALPAGLDRDCFVNGPQGTASEVEGHVQPKLMEAHHEQLEMPEDYFLSAAGWPVDVAVLDTWATQTNAGRSPHGFAMAGIIEGIACGALGTPCPIQVRPFLALDRFGPNHTRDPINGGTYGSQARLARAIHDALIAPGASHRIINISAGWDDRYNASTAQPGKRSHAVRAVEAALRFAACSRAIVITSAGNATGGPSPGDGPVYPGAYETKAAPACTGAVRPLVWSVGGVDGRDVPIANARPNARPTLAAPSFAVPALNQTTTTTDVVGPFTGSSVAAADVAALAAILWNLDGTLEPHEVMDIIQASAEPLTDVPDYSFGASNEILRISVCRAMAMAGANVDCPNPIGAFEGKNPDLAALLPTLLPLIEVKADGTGLDVPNDAGGVCSMPTLSSGALLSSQELCPDEVMSNDLLVPALDANTPKNPCPACLSSMALVMEQVSNPAEQDLSISLTLPITLDIGVGRIVTPQTLTLTLGGRNVARIDVGSATANGAQLRNGLVAGSTYSASFRVDEPLVYGVDYDAATIEWSNTATYQSSYPVIIER